MNPGVKIFLYALMISSDVTGCVFGTSHLGITKLVRPLNETPEIPSPPVVIRFIASDLRTNKGRNVTFTLMPLSSQLLGSQFLLFVSNNSTNIITTLSSNPPGIVVSGDVPVVSLVSFNSQSGNRCVLVAIFTNGS